MLRLKAALQLVGQPRDGAFQRFKLLVQIGAQAFQLGRFGQFLGADFFIEIRGIDGVVRVGIGIGRGRRGLQRGLAVGQFGLVALLHVGAVFHGDLRLGLVFLLVLAALGAGLGLVAFLVFRTLAVGVVLIFLGLVAGLILIWRVRVIAQLVAIAEIRDHLARKAGKGCLIGQHMIQIVERAAGLFFDKATPQVHDVFGGLGQRVAGGQMAHKIACGDRKWRLAGACDGGIALAISLMGDLGVDVGGRAGHDAGTHRLAAGGLHRVVDLARQLPGGGIAVGGRLVVILALQCEGVGGAAGQKHLIARHAARDLRQANAVFGHPRRVDRIGDGHLRIIGHDAGGLGKGLFERISGVVVGFGHDLPRFAFGWRPPLPSSPTRGEEAPLAVGHCLLSSRCLPPPFVGEGWGGGYFIAIEAALSGSSSPKQRW